MKKLIILICLTVITVQAWSQRCRPRNGWNNQRNCTANNYGWNNWNNNYGWRNQNNCVSPGAAVAKNVLITLSNFIVNATIPDNCYYDNYYYNGNNQYTLCFRDAYGYTYQRRVFRNIGQNCVYLNWRR